MLISHSAPKTPSLDYVIRVEGTVVGSVCKKKDGFHFRLDPAIDMPIYFLHERTMRDLKQAILETLSDDVLRKLIIDFDSYLDDNTSPVRSTAGKIESVDPSEIDMSYCLDAHVA